jgi:hypothetical protein
LGSLLIIFFFTVLAAWFVFAARAARVLDIKPTHLILRNDGCNFLKANGIETKPIEFGNGCSVLVPFRQNMIGSGGQITLGEKQIRITDDQVVIVGSVENQPWTAEQTDAVMEMVVSTIILLGMMAWLVRLISKNHREHNDK